jgi:sodium-dependent dicarboxylate transporter 2/3/5
LSEHLNREIGFVEWLPVGLFATTLLGVSAFFILARSLKKVQLTETEQQETESHLSEEWSRLGKITPVQKRVAIIFTGTALLWILRPYLGALSAHIHWSDTGISLIAALLLFSLTTGGQNLLNWESTSKLPWGILILFGGGLALAGTLQQSYWFEALEVSMKSFENTPILLWVVIMALLGVFATELLSNMALVSALMPLVLSLSQTFGWSMEILSVPLVLGASCAFMLPMATPPNAIVFSTGKLTVSYMMSRGIVLNILSVILLTALGMGLLIMG